MKLYQVNTKGTKVLKVIGTGSAVEATKYALSIVKRAQGMQPKDGAKYLRVLGISKAQPIHFEKFSNHKLQKLGTIRLGQFITDYSAETLEAIINELENA